MKAETAGNIIWITGASSGIGVALVKTLAQSGHTVVASGRNQIALEQLALGFENIIPMVCDNTCQDSLAAAYEVLNLKLAHLVTIILNAGSCEYLDFPDPDWGAANRVMDVNFHGTINSLRIALPFLPRSKANRAHIVCIASLVSNAAFPKGEIYGASKAALQYFFSSLRLDLAKERIDVTVINPGFIDTPLTKKNEFYMPFLMPVEKAAQRIVQAFKNRPETYSFPKRLRALLLLSKISPALWGRRVTPSEEKA